MNSKSHPHRPSPLDGAMIQMLALLEGRSTSFSGTRDLSDLAEIMEVPIPFVEGLFTSARRRGLLRAESAGRGKIIWTITSTGERLLANARDQTMGSEVD